MQAAFHLATSLGLLAFYHPPRRSDYPKLSLKEYFWSIDPIGSFLFICSTTLMLLGLDWAAGSYPWHDLHIAVPLGLGCGLLLAFCGYGKNYSHVDTHEGEWLIYKQNGRVDLTAFSRTSSLKEAQFLHYLFLHLLLKGV